jgi:Cytochrome c554 and c-prime
MAGASRRIAISLGGIALLTTLALGLLFGTGGAAASAQHSQAPPPTVDGPPRGNFLGVASCSGTTCHGHSVADGPVVRQDEIVIWQDPASAAGAHSRAFAILQQPRSRQIAERLGIGEASSAPECVGCHATPAPPAQRGARFLRSDGVGCESCHGAASGWLNIHYSVGANHAQNVRFGMVPLENARARAGVCLDCHFGNEARGQFVSHRLMAAGHPRISFELDLFSTLQAHHEEDADYQQRKPGRATNVQMWAIGQAMALQRSLTLFTDSPHGRDGIFPEFYFLDCHSCHRQIRDAATFDPTVVANRGRMLPPGIPPYNDENMIMLSAAARVVAPALGRRFDESTRAFYEAMSADGNPRGDDARVRLAAQRLRQDAAALVDLFARTSIGNAQVFQIIDTITGNAVSERFTDYAGSVQAVMATDTLLSSLVITRAVTAEQVQAIRGDINIAYQAVRDPNRYSPQNFRASLGRAASAIRRLR